MIPLPRRRLLAFGALALGGLACERLDPGGVFFGDGGERPSGRLTARPGDGIGGARHAGRYPLGLAEQRDATLRVPTGYTPARPWPLVVAFHGAGGRARGGLRLFDRYADDDGMLVLAPPSRETSWDARTGAFGKDARFVDRALSVVFSRYRIDPERVAVAGFSDGASYALSLGLANGDLFSHVIALSPGFVAGERRRGDPAVFVAHGTRDRVLPIDTTSRRIVRTLRRDGYAVTYVEFDGEHHIEPEITAQATRWFLGRA